MDPRIMLIFMLVFTLVHANGTMIQDFHPIRPNEIVQLSEQLPTEQPATASEPATAEDDIELITQVPPGWRYSLSDYISFVIRNSLAKPGGFQGELYDSVLIDSPRVLDKFFALVLKQFDVLPQQSKLSEENLKLLDQLLEKLASIRNELTL